MTNPDQRASREEEMFGKVEAYLSGALSQHRFCEQEHLPQSTFQYWLRKYRKIHSPEASSSRDFIPVRVTPGSAGSGISANCEIEVPGRVTIRFHTGSLDTSLLKLIHSLVK